MWKPIWTLWKHIHLGNRVTRLALSKVKQRPFHSRQNILFKTQRSAYWRPLNSSSNSEAGFLFPDKLLYASLTAKVLTSSFSHQGFHCSSFYFSTRPGFWSIKHSEILPMISNICWLSLCISHSGKQKPTGEGCNQMQR